MTEATSFQSLREHERECARRYEEFTQRITRLETRLETVTRLLYGITALIGVKAVALFFWFDSLQASLS